MGNIRSGGSGGCGVLIRREALVICGQLVICGLAVWKSNNIVLCGFAIVYRHKRGSDFPFSSY